VIAAEGTSVTWDRDTGAWEEFRTSGPKCILGTRAAYDEQSDRIVLFGGLDLDAFTVSDQTWAYHLNAKNLDRDESRRATGRRQLPRQGL
jgi:hypothetical protein